MNTKQMKELSKQRAKMRHVAPLEWEAGYMNDGVICHTIFGSIKVDRRWTGEETGDDPEGDWQWSYCFDEYYDEGREDCEDVEDGKLKAEAFYLSRIAPAFVGYVAPTT